MRTMLARAIMALTTCCLDERRRTWAAAMRAEFDYAGRPLSFALGCFGAALRDMPTREEGRFALSSYALVLGVMLPMAAWSIACAFFGTSYLYPSQELSGAMLRGMNAIYHAATPALTLVLLMFGLGHLRIAWAMLEGDWDRVVRLSMLAMAAAVTLVTLMSVLFLDIHQAALQTVILSIELATVMLVARWHARLFPAGDVQQPG